MNEDLFFLFPELKSGERIYKIINTYIFPELENLGFKMSKSNLSIYRKIGEFKQEIYFSKNRYNNGYDEVSFVPQFNITSTQYVKWHKSIYGIEPLNNIILYENANYLNNWNIKYFKDGWYNLATYNNQEIIKYLSQNIDQNGLPFLDMATDKNKIINYVIENSIYYKAPMIFDFAFTLNQKDLAIFILDWFNKYKTENKAEFMDETLLNLKKRSELLNNWV